MNVCRSSNADTLGTLTGRVNQDRELARCKARGDVSGCRRSPSPPDREIAWAVVATRSSPLRRPDPQPPNLASMVDFMANDMKPLEVIVHPLPVPK